MDDAGNTARRPARPWMRRIAVGAAAAAALWLAWWAGGGVTREQPLRPRGGFKKIENAWMASVPRELRGRIDAGSAVVLEEGRALWRPTSRRIVEAGEPGTCFVRRDVIVFVPGDGTDPGANGRTYVVRGPATLPWGWLAGIGLGLAMLQIAASGRGGASGFESRSWSSVACAGLLVATFAARAVWLWLHPDYNDGFMMAKGCPYSDAQVWLELAHSLAHGFGLEGSFAAQRPLYGVLLAPGFAAGVPELFFAQLANAAAGALTATLLAAVVAAMAGRAAGLGVLAVAGFTGFQWAMMPLAMSETVAMCFVALALLFILRGLCSGRAGVLVVGGAMFGLANLVCTFTPLVIVLSAALAAVAGYLSKRRLATSLRHGGAVVLGAALVLGPWVLRQQIVYGVPTISLQAAEMLYAPVSSSGRFSTGMIEEAARAGVPDEPAKRYRYFSGEWRRKVTADPIAYATTIARNLAQFFAAYPFEAIPLRALLLLAAAATACRAGTPRASACAWAAAALTGLVIWSVDWWPRGCALLMVAAGAVATRSPRRRWLALMLVALVLGVGAMDALTGNSITRRFWSSAEGAVVVLAVMAVAHTVEALSSLIAHGMRRTAGPPDTLLGNTLAGWFITGAAVAMGTWVAGAAGWVIWRTSAGPRESVASITQAQRERASAETVRRSQAPVSAADSRVWIEAVELTGRGCLLHAGENIHHWSRAFAVRPEARTVVFGRVAPDRRIQCFFVPGSTVSPEAQGKFVVVGIRSIDPRAPLAHDAEIIETIAMFPILEDEGEGRVDLAGGTTFAPSAEARRLMGW